MLFELSFERILRDGIADVEFDKPDTLAVFDYTAEEKLADEMAADWDLAFEEVE